MVLSTVLSVRAKFSLLKSLSLQLVKDHSHCARAVETKRPDCLCLWSLFSFLVCKTKIKVKFKVTGTLGGEEGCNSCEYLFFYRNVYSCFSLAFSVLAVVFCFV